ncbi:MAG TPA: CHRD domain-containing protein [Gemmatimonadaceae bacterium]
MASVSRLFRAAGLIAATAYAAPARAQTWTAVLNGPSESPPNTSAGTGTATMTLSGNIFTVTVNFAGLSGTTTASHIHCCVAPPGATGVATQVPTFSGFPLGVTSGTYNNTFDVSMASFYNPAFITSNGGTVASARAALFAGMNSGQAYLNIHTTVVPGGEIRGFIVLTPEPSSLLLIASGLGAVGGLVRWRRRDA